MMNEHYDDGNFDPDKGGAIELSSVRGRMSAYSTSQLEKLTIGIREAVENAARKSPYKNVLMRTEFPFELSGCLAWQIIYENQNSVHDDERPENENSGFMVYMDSMTGEFSFEPEYGTTKDTAKMLETIEKLLCPEPAEVKKAS